MTRFRTLLVRATIVLPIVISLSVLDMDRMLWPFAHYPMYSGLYGPTTAITRAVGVVSQKEEQPLPREIGLTGLHLHVVIDHAQRQSDSAARLSRIATALFTHYERLRAAGVVAGPRITEVKIYRDSIQLATTPHMRSTTVIARGRAP